jgi:flagellar biosynthesis/type III secretory pathway chaperone
MTPTTTLDSSTTHLIADAEAHLRSELATLQSFVHLVTSIQTTLGTEPRSDLSSYQQAQQQLAEESAALGERRRQLQSRIAAATGLDPQHASIRRLIDTLPEPAARPLAELRQQLLETHESIGRLTRSNVLLLRQSMDLVQSILFNLTGGGTTPTTYTANGQIDPAQRVNLVRKDC